MRTWIQAFITRITPVLKQGVMIQIPAKSNGYRFEIIMGVKKNRLSRLRGVETVLQTEAAIWLLADFFIVRIPFILPVAEMRKRIVGTYRTNYLNGFIGEILFFRGKVCNHATMLLVGLGMQAAFLCGIFHPQSDLAIFIGSCMVHNIRHFEVAVFQGYMVIFQSPAVVSISPVNQLISPVNPRPELNGLPGQVRL